MSDVPDDTIQIGNLDSPSKEIQEILIGQIDGVEACLKEVEASADSSIHQMRKHGKKIRGILRLISPGIPEGDYGAADALARGYAKWFSEMRDAFVMRETWDELVGEDETDREAVDKIHGELEEAHQEAIAPEKMQLAVSEALRQLGLLRTVAVQIPLDHLQREHLKAGELLLFEKGKEELNLARETRCPEDLHAWRKRAKYLSFHYELLGIPDSEKAADLGSMLGKHHDLAVLAEWLEARGNVDQRWLAKIEEKQKELESSAISLGEELYEGVLAATA